MRPALTVPVTRSHSGRVHGSAGATPPAAATLIGKSSSKRPHWSGPLSESQFQCQWREARPGAVNEVSEARAYQAAAPATGGRSSDVTGSRFGH
jgi:hypothetical protein